MLLLPTAALPKHFSFRVRALKPVAIQSLQLFGAIWQSLYVAVSRGHLSLSC